MDFRYPEIEEADILKPFLQQLKIEGLAEVSVNPNLAAHTPGVAAFNVKLSSGESKNIKVPWWQLQRPYKLEDIELHLKTVIFVQLESKKFESR